MSTGHISIDATEQTFIDQTIATHSGRPGALLGIMEAVQEHHPHKYLPPETLRYIGREWSHLDGFLYYLVTSLRG